MGLIERTKPVRIAFNMLCCAVLFAWADPRPRETISGLFGRKCSYKPVGRFWYLGQRFINWIHPHEPDHCYETWQYEIRMRNCLYGTD